jgi:folate-binding protein YgfZ
MPDFCLSDRAFISVSGADAAHFLQGLITTDVASIGPGEAWPGALLTPQGKIQFEFLISRDGDGFLLETAASSADTLLRRLMLYRLRARVDLSRRPEPATAISRDEPGSGARDMRFSRAGLTFYRLPSASPGGDALGYRALRIAHGVSGGAEDGVPTDNFPHDLMMDLNGGLNFRKGCYVGQEVVSRMQHRSTARRRLVTARGTAPLPDAGTPVFAGEREIGALTSVEGDCALAVVRIDKAGAAMASGEPITAGGIPLSLTLPDWSGLAFPAETEDAQP